MVNYNGKVYSNDAYFLPHNNRAFTYGDALVERIRLLNGKLVFWEDHYFRLMASMRMLRMQIPMQYTMEFLEQEIKKVLDAPDSNTPTQIQLTIFRQDLISNTVHYLIAASTLKDPLAVTPKKEYPVALYKDFYVSDGLLSSLYSIDSTLEIVAGIFARENGFEDCFLLNTKKNVVGTVAGNLFLVAANTLKTPPLIDGAKNGILRKKAVEIFSKQPHMEIEEQSISPFELQKADELFTVNDIDGVQAVTKYRKKSYTTTMANRLTTWLNERIRLELYEH